MPRPNISVVICTYDQALPLSDVLGSLSVQTLPLQDYEVIVVDNNPDGEQVSAITSAIRLSDYSDCPAHLRYVHCPLPGLSHARNAGISEARGDILCFIDDDAFACPDWLEQIAQAFAAHPGTGVIGGHIVLQPPETSSEDSQARPRALLEPVHHPLPRLYGSRSLGRPALGSQLVRPPSGPLGHRRLSHGLRSPRS